MSEEKLSDGGKNRAVARSGWKDSQADRASAGNGHGCPGWTKKDVQSRPATLSPAINHLVTRNPLSTCVTYTRSDNVKQLVAVFRGARSERAPLFAPSYTPLISPCTYSFRDIFCPPPVVGNLDRSFLPIGRSHLASGKNTVALLN